MAQTRTGGCNFSFALHAMILLEWAARLCRRDATGQALRDLSAALTTLEPRYFIELPGACGNVGGTQFDLPSTGPNPNRELLSTLFDLIRNGQAHQYQQVMVDLSDGRRFAISVVKPVDMTLAAVRASGRSEHLDYSCDADGDVWLKVRPEWLFLDFRDAIEHSNLLGRGLTFENFARGGGPHTYNYSSTDLETAFGAADLTRY